MEFGETDDTSQAIIDGSSSDAAASTEGSTSSSSEAPEGSGSTGSGESGNASGSDAESVEELIEQFVLARCEAAFGCDCGLDPALAGTIEQCVERERDLWSAPSEEAAVRDLEFDLDCYVEKVGVLAASSCAPASPAKLSGATRTHACDLWVGDGVEGMPCESSVEGWSTCAAGLTCQFGTCLAPSSTGPCEDVLACTEGSRCIADACVAAATEGESCSLDLECEEALRCGESGMCEQAAPIGSACIEQQDCLSMRCAQQACAPALPTVCVGLPIEV